MPPLADIIQDVIHRNACPLNFRATAAIDDLCTHGVPRLSCLMQQRDHNTSGGPQAVRDTAPGLDVLCLGADWRKKEHVTLALVVALVMKIFHVLRECMAERRFPKEDQPRQA